MEVVVHGVLWAYWVVLVESGCTMKYIWGGICGICGLGGVVFSLVSEREERERRERLCGFSLGKVS